jgi:glycosyltransferase involved in cell wall biosynthesis
VDDDWSADVKVLVVANDHVGSRMAGPGIRALRLAEELAKRFDVTLQIPYESDIEPTGVRLLVGNPYDARRMTVLATGFDAVVAQRLPVPTLRALGRAGTRTVYDLYAPLTIENLAFDAGRRLGSLETAYFRLNTLVQEAVLRYGDAFICASETQRDLWLGSLLALGRIDHDAYARDPTFRSLIDVVPFGIDETPPSQNPSLRDVVPGIGDETEILLWPGGIWNWFDPLTVIRAVAALRNAGRDLWLVFLGLQHPNPGVPAMAKAGRALALADELGLTGRGVHVNPGWVPHEQRGGWLLEADLGVSAHLDELESRFAYRTRLLDCFWAGLPVVVTDGDALARVVAERRIGRVVAPGDVRGWSDAVGSLLDDAVEREAMRGRLADVAAEFSWPRVAVALVDLIEGRWSAPKPGHDAVLASYAARRVEYAVAARGVRGTARRLAAIAGEQLAAEVHRIR